jgi:LysM repeat protein
VSPRPPQRGSKQQRRPRATGAWTRWAAPTAFLAAATIAIVLVASALHGDRKDEPPARTPAARTTTAHTPTRAKTETVGKRTYYTVVPGDTFGTIAAKTGASVADLERLNPGVSSTALHIGQKIRVG